MHHLRDAGQAVEAYDDHFRRNGDSVKIIAFDDSTVTNQEKYYGLFDAGSCFDLHRIPGLFCGFVRDSGGIVVFV